MAEPRFIHLRVHSDYSMIDGLAKTAPLVKRAAALAMPALAITDFTNLCGLVKFYGSAHGAGIKPIIGADFHVQSEELGDELAQLTVLASNNEGYQNLTLLISRAYQRGYGAAGPTIDRDWLIEHREGLILLSGARQGDVGKFLLRGNRAQVDQCPDFYQQHFPDCYYGTDPHRPPGRRELPACGGGAGHRTRFAGGGHQRRALPGGRRLRCP